SDSEAVTACHFYCEENGLVPEWRLYREKTESMLNFCALLDEFVDGGLCADIQMIAYGSCTADALPEIRIDREKARTVCAECKWKL
ncbi:MAG: hypothetical protein ACI3XR_01685, partial [Eubacteriales bacterium]